MKALDFFKTAYKGSDIVAGKKPIGRSPKKDIGNGICGHCDGDCGSADSR